MISITEKDIFVCDNCGSVEQIRTGYFPEYHNLLEFDSDDPLKSLECLCSGCVPKKLANGSPSGYSGTWHNKFPRKKWKDWKYPKVLNREQP